MEPHPLPILLNHQSHPQALECPMEPGDSQWDEDDLSFLIIVSDLCVRLLVYFCILCLIMVYRCTDVEAGILIWFQRLSLKKSYDFST